jgi:hypothetical protein
VLFPELLKIGGHEAMGPGSCSHQRPMPFTLLLDATGLLKVSLAGVEATTNLGTFKPDSIELSCSTGDFEFTDVVVTEK